MSTTPTSSDAELLAEMQYQRYKNGKLVDYRSGKVEFNKSTLRLIMTIKWYRENIDSEVGLRECKRAVEDDWDEMVRLLRIKIAGGVGTCKVLFEK